jgi:uncharacterized membrane protein
MVSVQKPMLITLLAIISLVVSVIPVFADTDPSDTVSLLVPFREMTATPDQSSIDMPLGIVNRTQDRLSIEIKVLDAPSGWNIGLWDSRKNYKIEHISAEGLSVHEAELRLALPKETQPGTYQFSIQAASLSGSVIYETIPILILVKKPENPRIGTVIATSDFPVLSGPTTALFEFQINVKNRTSHNEQFALSAETPMGWGIGFFPGWQQERDQSISNFTVEKSGNSRVEIQVMPPRQASPGRYTVSVTMSNEQRTIIMPLTVRLTGSGILLSRTASGLREMEAQPGNGSPALFRLLNIGTAEMEMVSLQAETPSDEWTVHFDRKTIDVLEVNAQADIGLSIVPPSDVIPGDYIVTIQAIHPDSDTAIDLRVTVKDTNSWAWLGGLVVLIVLGSIGGLFWRLWRRS